MLVKVVGYFLLPSITARTMDGAEPEKVGPRMRRPCPRELLSPFSSIQRKVLSHWIRLSPVVGFSATRNTKNPSSYGRLYNSSEEFPVEGCALDSCVLLRNKTRPGQFSLRSVSFSSSISSLRLEYSSARGFHGSHDESYVYPSSCAACWIASMVRSNCKLRCVCSGSGRVATMNSMCGGK